jgi:hypothetical protein
MDISLNNIVDTSDNTIDNINLVMNQTDYNYATAQTKLIEFNNDYIKVIRDYLQIEEKKPVEKSLNQQMFSEMRSFFQPTNLQ